MMASQQQSLSEQRFHAAVNVIRGLPKNGSYQPSHDMQLRFYSYFKQATEGRCNQKKPGIWNPVSRAKWEAWNRLGGMSAEKAMDSYVEELKRIIETMSYTDNVADFMGSISELDGVSVDDLEAVAPETIQKARSHPNSPFASREVSPMRAPYLNGHDHQNGFSTSSAAEQNNHLTNGHNETLAIMNGNGGSGYHNGHLTEQSDDEYIDTIDDYDAHSFHSDTTTSTTATTAQHTSRPKVRYQAAVSVPANNLQVTDGGRTRTQAPSSSVEMDLRFHNVLSQLNLTVERINVDVQQVMTRMAVIERSMNEAKSRRAMTRRNVPKWWPFRELSPKWVVFIVLWPFVAQKLMRMMSKKK